MEVRSISCKDDGTQKVLQEIIQEATNRLSRLQKQEMLDSLGQGNAQLYFTPSDVDITIESKQGD